METIKFLIQYVDEGDNRVDLPDDIDQPVEGFQVHAVEPLSTLVRRLSLGQEVPFVAEGIDFDDQVFETENLEIFDVLDASDNMDKLVRERKSEDIKKKASPPKPQADKSSASEPGDP